MRTFGSVVAAASLLLLTGCQSSGMRDQTIAYNEAVADSTNQFFLLNVLRARDRFPLYYTRTTGNSASQGASAGAAVEIENWHQLPSIVAGGSTSNTVSMANLDDQKFMRGVLTPVPLATLGFYLDQGWPKEVLLSLFISRLEIDASLVSSLIDKFNARCSANRLATYCADRRPAGLNDAAQASPGDYVRNNCMGGTSPLLFKNDPADAEDLLCFRGMLRVLVALGLGVTVGDKYTVIVNDMPSGSAFNLEGLGAASTAKLVVERRADGRYSVCSKEDGSAFTMAQETFQGDAELSMAGGFFDSPNMATTSIVTTPSLPTCAETATAKPSTGAKPVFRFTTRSLDSMIYYVGESVRAGNSVTIWTGSGRMREMPLFLVERNPSDELVSIDYRGGHYAIPDQCDGDDTCEQSHRSLQVLSLFNQIWGLQKEASEAPSVPVVSVINR
jgi:hypothetical protein